MGRLLDRGPLRAAADAPPSRACLVPVGGRVKPYYQDPAVTIYHGDCREVLPGLSADVLVSDPPYWIAYSPGGGGKGFRGKGKGWGKSFAGPDVVRGDSEPFDPAPLLALGLPSVLWGANHYADRLPASPTWLVWDKRRGLVRNDFADCEMAWSNIGGPARVYSHLWYGVWRDSDEDRLHPTQKPLPVMVWCLGLVPGGVVLDPFMGSGTTLRAAKDLGRKAIGIEIEERYCEIAARRMGQEVLSLG
jgi:site-specific DNA-methyltransferase (adenine-specific)